MHTFPPFNHEYPTKTRKWTTSTSRNSARRWPRYSSNLCPSTHIKHWVIRQVVGARDSLQQERLWAFGAANNSMLGFVIDLHYQETRSLTAKLQSKTHPKPYTILWVYCQLAKWKCAKSCSRREIWTRPACSDHPKAKSAVTDLHDL